MELIDEGTLRLFIENSVAVMTTDPQARAAWLSDLAEARRKALEAGAEHDAEFFVALTALIEGRKSHLAANNPYASAVKSVVEGIKAAASASGTISAEDLRTIIANTVAVLTIPQAPRDIWRAQLEHELRLARDQGQNWLAEAQLFNALIKLLDGDETHLPADNPYVGVLKQIDLGVQQGVPVSGTTPEQIEDTISRTLAALLDADALAAWRSELQGWFGTAKDYGLSQDADWFALLLGVLEGEAPELPADHRYAEEARLLQARLLAQMADGSDLALEEVQEVVRAFVSAPDWDQTEAVYNANQAALLSPEADDALQILLGQAQERGDEAMADVFELHRLILSVIKQEGPKATFAWIRAQDDLAD